YYVYVTKTSDTNNVNDESTSVNQRRLPSQETQRSTLDNSKRVTTTLAFIIHERYWRRDAMH
ncbi:hypothetical protein SK128_015305, partial [Halocaridina rubra]